MTEYQKHPHKVTLADGRKYPTYNFIDEMPFNDLVYLSMNCTVCGERVLVKSHVIHDVLKSIRLRPRSMKQWATLDYFDRPA